MYLKHSPLIIALIILLVQSKLCYKQKNIQINLAQYKIPKTNTYKYAIDIRKDNAIISKSQNGTSFKGNFSIIVLKNQQGVQFVYDSIEFGFQCPALHKPTKLNQQLIQLQISHRIRKNQQSQNNSVRPPYEWLLFSFPFMISQYVPQNIQSINNLLQNIQKNQIIDLKQIIKQLVSAQTMVYTTRQRRFGDKSILRMVRKQIRLISKQQFKKLKFMIQGQTQLQINNQAAQTQTIDSKPQRIYQVKSYPFQQSIAFKKQDL